MKLMKAIIKKRFTLTNDHKRIVSMLEDTELDFQIANLWHHYRSCRVFINGQDVTYSFNVWRDASLEVGQEIIVEIVPEWRLK